jgi:hypothetical protein
VYLTVVTRFYSCIFFRHLLQRQEVETPLENSKPQGDALEELIGAQALSADLKTALVACLTGRESRRWTVGELSERLNNLGLRCSKPAVIGALGELEIEMALCPFLPWVLAEQGTEWSLVPKSEFLELLSGVRKFPGISADTLTDEHKAVLLVVIGYRHKGGVSKTRINDILKLDSSPYLDDLWKRELVYTAPGKELSWWRPTPESLLVWACVPTPISRNSKSSSATLIPRSPSKTRKKDRPTWSRYSRRPKPARRGDAGESLSAGPPCLGAWNPLRQT